MYRDILEQAGKASAPLVGDQQHAVTAAFQFRGQRMSWNHVSAGAASGQNEVHVVRLSPLHFTT